MRHRRGRDPPDQAGQRITADEFRCTRPVFEAKVRCYQPRVVAFLGKRALAAMLATPIAWGRQSSPFAGVTAWVLPNPSGLNRGFTLDALVRAYSELHAALTEPS